MLLDLRGGSRKICFKIVQPIFHPFLTTVRVLHVYEISRVTLKEANSLALWFLDSMEFLQNCPLLYLTSAILLRFQLGIVFLKVAM